MAVEIRCKKQRPPSGLSSRAWSVSTGGRLRAQHWRSDSSRGSVSLADRDIGAARGRTIRRHPPLWDLAFHGEKFEAVSHPRDGMVRRTCLRLKRQAWILCRLPLNCALIFATDRSSRSPEWRSWSFLCRIRLGTPIEKNQCSLKGGTSHRAVEQNQKKCASEGIAVVGTSEFGSVHQRPVAEQRIRRRIGRTSTGRD